MVSSGVVQLGFSIANKGITLTGEARDNHLSGGSGDAMHGEGVRTG